MTSTETILGLAEELRVIADEIAYNAHEDSSEFLKRGTIVKAKEVQNRFKPKSMWVSLGDGTYKHITGKKGLVTKQSRLDGFVDVVFTA
jgi:ribosomal protein S8E